MRAIHNTEKIHCNSGNFRPVLEPMIKAFSGAPVKKTHSGAVFIECDNLTIAKTHVNGVFSVMEMESVVRVQIMDKAVCVQLPTNALRKSTILFLLPSAMCKQ